MRKAAAIYAIFIGMSMLGMWFMFYFTNSIHELQTRPVEIMIHIFAEVTTALALIVSGYSLLKNWERARKLFFISMGMLLYTLFNSSGYFIQNGEVPLIIMFLTFIVTTLFLLVRFE